MAARIAFFSRCLISYLLVLNFTHCSTNHSVSQDPSLVLNHFLLLPFQGLNFPIFNHMGRLKKKKKSSQAPLGLQW